MKKILYILPDLHGGGAEKVTLSIIEALNQHTDNQADLFLFCKRGEHLDKLPDNTHLYYSYEKELPRLHHFRTIKKLYDISKRYDIIVGSLEILSILYAAVLSILTKKPAIAWVHKNLDNYYEHIPLKKKLPYSFLLSNALKQCQHVIGVSKGVSNAITNNYPFLKNKTVTIYNPFNFSEIIEKSEERIDPTLESIFDKPVILAVGRLTYPKNYPLLLKIHRELLDIGYDHNLLILGEGEDREKLEQQVETLNIEKSCYIPGFKNPYPYMKKATVMLMTSHYEGLPTVLIEAMILDTLLCSVDCKSGPREILDNGTCGLLLAPPEQVNAQDASVAIKKILKDTIRQTTFKKNMMKQTKKFSEESSCTDWQKLFNNSQKEVK